jgi:CheY-like chemotaxis protein
LEPISIADHEIERKKIESNIIGIKGKDRKVLVADNNANNRSLLIEMLSPFDFEIFEARDGEECFKKTVKYKPDVILMDLVMPVMDGYKTTQRIRKSSELKDVVIIAVSASTFKADHENCLNAGCNDFIDKPFKSELLFEKLATNLELDLVYKDENEILSKQMPIVIPSAKEMSVLSKFILKGDIKGIIDWTKKIEHKDEKYLPYVTEVRGLAESFQIERIKEKLENYKHIS